MAYPHDFALCVPLSSGQVLLGGGAEKPLGIGQTHTTEVYDPATHSFDHYGCLDTKRMHANGVETDSEAIPTCCARPRTMSSSCQAQEHGMILLHLPLPRR